MITLHIFREAEGARLATRRRLVVCHTKMEFIRKFQRKFGVLVRFRLKRVPVPPDFVLELHEGEVEPVLGALLLKVRRVDVNLLDLKLYVTT